MKTNEHVQRIRDLSGSGLSQRKIAERLGLTRQIVRYALKKDLIRQSPAIAKRLFAVGQKRCPLCKAIKLLEDFPSNRASKDGRGSHCHFCNGELGKARPKEEKRAAYRRDKTKRRDLLLRRNFGITLETYNQILTSQQGVCAICKKTSEHKALAVDHDHKTGKIRGLLCGRCNPAIGMLIDSPELVQSAMDYLQKHQKV